MTTNEAEVGSLRSRWAADPVASSDHIRRDVDLAVSILQEEGYQLDDSVLVTEIYKKSLDDGSTDTVTVMRGHMNGTMLFVNDQREEPVVKMAWDYNSEMRPGPIRRFAKKLGFGS